MRKLSAVLYSAIVVSGGFLPRADAGAIGDVATIVIRVVRQSGDNAQSVAISPDGKLVATAYGGWRPPGTRLKPGGAGIAIWETATGKPVQSVTDHGDKNRLAFSGDGKSLAYARTWTPGDGVDDDAVVVLDVETCKIRKRWWWGGTGFLICPQNDTILVVQGRETKAYDLRDFTIVKAFDQFMPQTFGSSANGKWVAAVREEKEMVVRTIRGEEKTFYRFVVKGLVLLNGSDLAEVRGIQNPEFATCLALSLSSSGAEIASGHSGGTVRIWDAEKMTEIRKIECAGEGYLFPLYSPDGTELAVATQPAGMRWKYDRLDRAGSEIQPDSASPGCEIVFFSVPGYKPLRRWHLPDASYKTSAVPGGPQLQNGEGNTGRFAFSPDGKQLVAGVGGVTLIDVETGKIVRQFGLDP